MSKADALKLARVAAAEANRAYEHLRARRGSPKLYFLSYLIRDERTWGITGRFGNVLAEEHRHRRNCLADLRVGTAKYDQVHEGGLHDNDDDVESDDYVNLPTGSRPEGLAHSLWRLTDARYREAVEAYHRKKTEELTYLNQFRHLRSLEDRVPVVDRSWESLPSVDEDYWRGLTLRASAMMRKLPRVYVGSVSFHSTVTTRVFVSTEGSLQIQRMPDYSLEGHFWMLSPKGDGLTWAVRHRVRDLAELPDEKTFRRELREAARLLAELAAAPTVRSFSGPVLLEPRPAGLLIHEALGHRLEGNRLLSPGEGQTYRDSVGKEILPPFLSVWDDPRLTSFEGQSLIGHYRYDDEGVPTDRAQLIDRGVLKSFLTTRAAIGRGHRSNGHARSERHQRAISRMGVTVVDSHDGLSEADMRQRFLQEIREQGVPYGVRILQADGGETATEGYNFQAFLGDINLASRVFPDGREEWIRGVDFVGTPLNAARGIVAAGRRREVDNADCGAESGFVPVSTVSPSLLISRLELQSKAESPYTQYTYPMPWE